MAYQSDLSSWGATGTEPPANYSYEEGEQPVDEWDNWFNYTVISELTDVIDLINDIDADTDGVVDEAESANAYKGNDIDSDGDGTVDAADSAANVTGSYKGNDIDSDGDGTVDDADRFDGTSPSDGSDGQILTTDGTSASWGNQTVVSDTYPNVGRSGRSWVRLGDRGAEVFESELDVGNPGDVVAEDGVVYGITYNTTPVDVTAYNISNGSKLWTHNHHSSGNGHQIDADGDVVVSGANDNNVIAADASDGSQLWSHSHHSDNIEGIEIVGDLVVSCSADNTVVAAARSDGSLVWSHTEHTSDVERLSVDRGYVYSSDMNGDIIRVNLSDGGSPQTFQPQTSGSVDAIDVDNGLVYIVIDDGSNDDYVEAYQDSGSGLISMWSSRLATDDTHNGSAIHYSEGVAYAFSPDVLTAYDAKTGNEMWTKKPVEDTSSGTAFGVYEYEGIVYYASGSPGQNIRGLIADKARYVSDGNEWLFESRIR